MFSVFICHIKRFCTGLTESKYMSLDHATKKNSILKLENFFISCCFACLDLVSVNIKSSQIISVCLVFNSMNSTPHFSVKGKFIYRAHLK